VLHQSYNIDIGYIYSYLKLSVLWLHILFSPVMRVDLALCGVPLHIVHDPHALGCDCSEKSFIKEVYNLFIYF